MKKDSTPDSQNTQGKTVAIVLLVLCIVIALILSFLAFSSRAQVLTELSDTQNQLQISRDLNAQLQTQVETMRSANNNAQYILISDMGVRIPKTTDLQNVITGVETVANPKQPFAHFTSGEILAAVMSNPAGPYSSNQCALGDSPLGVITRYSSGSIVFGKKVETITDPNVKKIGDYYFVYSNAATSCTSNKTVSDYITAQQQKFAAAFANLEAITASVNN